jgi:seryl-tRNA synthetase
MESVEQARRVLENREKAFLKLTDEQKGLREKIETLQKDRSQAVRDLAKQDEGKNGPLKKKISDLEIKIAPLALRMEGLESLVKEAEEEAGKARQALNQAQIVWNAKLKTFLESKENGRLDTHLAFLSDNFVKAITDSYLKTCGLAFEAIVDSIRIYPDGEARMSPEAHKILFALADLIGREVERRGYRRAHKQWPGGAVIEIIPLVAPGTEGVPAGAGLVDPDQTQKARYARRVQGWSEEFKKEG